MRHPGSLPGMKTLADWLAQPEDARLEFIDGELVQKAAPTILHAQAQRMLSTLIGGPFGRRSGGSGGPGGWWIVTEVDIALGGHGYRPDVAGWRRERLPTLPNERPVTLRPDWICEVVSESNRAVDTAKKVVRYHQAGVPHYWILDPTARCLFVYRHAPEGYLLVLVASAEERVRAEPFAAIELKVGELLGDDPE